MISSLITPFKINVSDAALSNLKSRLKDTVLPSEIDGGFSMGPNNRYIGGLLSHLLGDYDWRVAEKNIWKVERMLLEWPHRRINWSKAREQRWRARYRAFCDAHDYKPWKFYPRRDRWTALPEHVRRRG